MAPSKFEVEEIVVFEHETGGGSFYRRDKYIHLTNAEWTKLFSLDFDFDKPEHKLLLADNALQPKFVKIEIYNGVSYLDIRHWYFHKEHYYPSRLGVKLKQNEWNDIKEWANA